VRQRDHVLTGCVADSMRASARGALVVPIERDRAGDHGHSPNVSAALGLAWGLERGAAKAG
jgi:hypothetical protein